MNDAVFPYHASPPARRLSLGRKAGHVALTAPSACSSIVPSLLRRGVWRTNKNVSPSGASEIRCLTNASS